MLNVGHKYRVFVSYSHQDAELVDRISSILEENGLQPMLDRSFSSGQGFTNQIKNFIAHSHVFMPVITKESSSRGWVHQEIGYAMALNIPVLPISNGQMPGQMIQELQAVRWEEGKYRRRKNKPKLSMKVLDSLVRRAQLDSQALFECTQYQEERTAMMVSYAKRVLELDACGHVRQKGALSSFNMPDKSITHPDWEARYGSHKPGDYRCRLQRDERLALEQHARPIFTRHAPSIQAKLELSDRELNELLNAPKSGHGNSRRSAIELISRILKTI